MDLGSLGRFPNRWATTEGFIYCDSSQRRRTMGLLQIDGVLMIVAGGGGLGQRWEAPKQRSLGIRCNFLVFEGLLCSWSGQLSMYPCRTYLYSYVSA